MLSEPPPELRPVQVFVDPSPIRAGLVLWISRIVALVILAYLVLLGASLARAPWAPRLSLPGLGPVVAPNAKTAPPVLGPGSLTTPIPAAVSSLNPNGHTGTGGHGASSHRGSTSPSGSGGTSSTTAVQTASTTSSPGNSGHATSTTRTSPSGTAPGRRATTTTSSGGVTTTTRAHGRGKP